MTKPFNPLELVARVKSQLRRYTQLGSTAQPAGEKIYATGGLMINDDLKEVTVDGEPVKLTPIEYNILLLLVRNQGKVFSIDQIYENIWNEDAIGVDNTVPYISGTSGRRSNRYTYRAPVSQGGLGRGI